MDKKDKTENEQSGDTKRTRIGTNAKKKNEVIEENLDQE